MSAREEILQLKRAGIGTASAEALLARMQAKSDELCAQRDEKKADRARSNRGYLGDGNGEGSPVVFFGLGKSARIHQGAGACPKARYP
ncbi:hypothetical protein WN72_13205 [Bradyrhizobium arachidis]|uniref:Uncharacterized protein n=1 Tax=Bradyrhizobium arachidis TaxID=858423 RepID=A0AAE7TGU9_9BRAD|nr:hypothetical protein WN72_13205 [Bradyrhizobium arachidis]